MKQILQYILKNSLRDRLYLGLFIVLTVSISSSIFLGSTMLIEQQETTAAYIAGSSRAILAIGMILFVCLNINRAFENKEIEYILSKAISRQQFVLGYLIGFFFVTILIFIPLISIIFIITKAHILNLLIWSSTLLFELLIVICFALLASLILKNSFLAIMASFAFYIISRLMGTFVLAIKLPQSFFEAKSHILTTSLKLLSALFPRLDLFAQSSWLSYNISNFANLKIIALQSIIYISLMIFMAFHDFKKRQF